ncbi:FxsA family protein [Brachybacterium sp. YJGR34]|uniref:FxsA family protein n=1 Tax=Brachybacterium sp. YJGR34 TaxID=2059911 RepID=UPI000E0AFF0A|nr:FxsA family protein [Brachybacterium sp. YJGR34]
MAAPQSSTPGTAPRPSRGSALLPLGILVLGLAELAILIVIGQATSFWWPVLIVVVGWVVGIALVVAAGQQSFVRLRSLLRAVRGTGDVQQHLSRPAFTLASAVLFFFPGLLTDLVGLLLLLTPVQRRSVAAMGLSSGSQGARTALYRRQGTGIIDGEIIVESTTRRSDDEAGPSAPSPPTITPG